MTVPNPIDDNCNAKSKPKTRLPRKAGDRQFWRCNRPAGHAGEHREYARETPSVLAAWGSGRRAIVCIVNEPTTSRTGRFVLRSNAAVGQLGLWGRPGPVAP